MESQIKEKVKEMHIGKNAKETASALVSDVKEIAKGTKDAAGGALDHVREGAKKTLHKVEKKLS